MNVTETSNSVSKRRLLSENKLKVNLIDAVKAVCIDTGLDSIITNYLMQRSRCEGIKFVCDILPKFGSEVLRAIELGNFNYFHKSFIRNHINVFRGSPFRVLLSRIFSECGRPRVNGDAAAALGQLLQVCEFFKKLELQNETFVNYTSVEGFIDKQNSLRSIPDLTTHEKAIARHISNRVFPNRYRDQHGFYHSAAVGDGPGTFSLSHRPVRGGTFVPHTALKRGIVNNSFCKGHRQYKKFILKKYPEGATFRARESFSELLLVPKTATKARVIVREPKHMLRLQRPYFYSRSLFLKNETKGRINIFSQDFNRSRAHSASVSRQYATVDFANASNSVLFKDVEAINGNCASFRNLYANSRTPYVFVPINWVSKDDTSDGLRAAFCSDVTTTTETFEMLERYRHFLTWPELKELARVFHVRDISRYTLTQLHDEGKISTDLLSLVGKSVLSEKEKLRLEKLKNKHCELVTKLEASSSRRIVYNNRLGYVVRLEMLAGMGSYLTFPHMMEYFHTLLVMSVVRDRFAPTLESRDRDPFSIARLPRNRSKLNKIIDEVSSQTSWLGDDGIYPCEYYECSVAYMATRGVQVNVSKTYANSHFRESCGPYYYFGSEITPTRCNLPVKYSNGYLHMESETLKLVKLAELCSNLKSAGMSKTAKLFRRMHNKAYCTNNLVGVLNAAHASHGTTVILANSKQDFYGITDRDKWCMYWNESRYKLTSYGETLYLEYKQYDDKWTKESFLDWAVKSLNIVVYEYDPLPQAVVPGSSAFKIQEDDYIHIDGTAEEARARRLSYNHMIWFLTSVSMLNHWFVHEQSEFA